MNTFSRLNLLTLLFLGIVLMLVGGTTDVYAQEAFLQATGDTDKAYDVGDRMETVFTATDADHEPVEGADLTITHVGLTDVTISNGGTTDEFGEVVVRGLITSSCVFVRALWPEGGNNGLQVEAWLAGCRDIDIDPSLWVDSSVDDHKLVEVGDEVTVRFFVDPPDEIPLHVSVKNVEVISIWGANDHHVPILPSNYTTNRGGELVVTGVFTGPGDAFIQAHWGDPLPHSDILISTAVFEVRGPLPSAIQVFNKYKETFRHPDVHEHFPDVLNAFKNPEVQNVLNSVVIHRFVRDPEYIRAFSPDVDASIITLLTTDNEFRTLFEDEQFQRVLQNPARIDELVKLIIEAQPLFRPEILALEVNFSSITGRNPDSGAPQGTVTVSAYTTAQLTVPEITSIRLSAGAAGSWEVKTSTRAGGREKWSVAVNTTILPDTITKNNPGARNAALDNRQYTVRAVAIGVDGTEWPSNFTVRFSVDNVDDVPPVGPTNIISVADADGPVEANEDGSYTVGGLIDEYDATLASLIAKFTVQPTAQPATYNSAYLVQTDPDGTEIATEGRWGQLEFAVDVGALENGTYMFHALAVDAVGNIQTDPSPKITVHIENWIEAQPPREPGTLTIVSGDLQEGGLRTGLGNPLVVSVRDQYGEPLSGVNVTFRVTRGDGRLSRTTARTGRTGRAETTLTLGAVPGIHQVEASVVGFPSLMQTFTAAATAVCEVPSLPRATRLSIVSGNNQSSEVGKPLAQPFVVGVLDQDGKPLQGTAVTFTVTAGGGQLSGRTIHTDVYGQARTTLTLGSGAGRHSVMARAAGIPQSQTFTATADAPPPPPEPKPVVSGQPSTLEPPLPPTPSLPVVYWIEEGAIFRLDGGNKQALVEPSGGWTVTSLAMDVARNKLYWTERQTGKQIGRIWSGDLNDRNARELQSITAVPEGIVVDAENGRLYWTNGRGKIQRIDIDGKDFKGNFIKGLGSPHHIALDSATGDIYWTVYDVKAGSWSIWRAPLNGNITKKEILSGLGRLGGIAVANDKLYWTEGGKISCANKRNGSGVKTLILLRGSVPLGLAVDEAGRRLYVTDNHGNIRSLNLDKPIETEIVVGSLDAPAVAIALGRSSGESIPASPAAPSTIAERSVESALLANYPNPFNPETWIPYQLSAAGDVSISIYSVDGHLVRRLELGHQVAGAYRSRDRAAYWDGRNEFGERVASGLYFYTLTADDFTATRKMLIRK